MESPMNNDLRLIVFFPIWVALLLITGAFILWPTVIGIILLTIILLGSTGAIAWGLTHLEKYEDSD
jgi:hypothetical protein